jgi:hypothetical protein
MLARGQRSYRTGGGRVRPGGGPTVELARRGHGHCPASNSYCHWACCTPVLVFRSPHESSAAEGVDRWRQQGVRRRRRGHRATPRCSWVTSSRCPPGIVRVGLLVVHTCREQAQRDAGRRPAMGVQAQLSGSPAGRSRRGIAVITIDSAAWTPGLSLRGAVCLSSNSEEASPRSPRSHRMRAGGSARSLVRPSQQIRNRYDRRSRGGQFSAAWLRRPRRITAQFRAQTALNPPGATRRRTPQDRRPATVPHPRRERVATSPPK